MVDDFGFYINVDRPAVSRIHRAECWVVQRWIAAGKKLEDGHWEPCKSVKDGKRIAQAAGCTRIEPCKHCKPHVSS